jgi:CheY-like chemotaxis protein
MGPERDRAGTVLVVEPDEDVRDRIGEWLEGEGFEVAGCPGPMRPDYSCVGSRSWMCPLERDAHVVVLDLMLAGDVAMEGTTAEELLSYYVWKGHPVVAMCHGTAPVNAGDMDHVTVISSPPVRDAIVAAVRDLVPDVTAGS